MMKKELEGFSFHAGLFREEYVRNSTAGWR